MRHFINIINLLSEALQEGPLKDGRISVLTASDHEPKYLYRIMSPAEWAAAQKVGYLSSFDGRIHASEHPLFQYCEPGENVLIKILYVFDDGWRAKWTSDEVVAIADHIPITRVVDVKIGTKSDLMR